MIGFAVWWHIAPIEVLLKPGTLAATDLGLLYRVAKDTFLNHVCSTHQIANPCECGEPLNEVARDLLKPTFFDLQFHMLRASDLGQECLLSQEFFRIGREGWY